MCLVLQRGGKHVAKSLIEALLHEKRREKTPVTDIKVFSDDTHQSFDATHTREYNVHV